MCEKSKVSVLSRKGAGQEWNTVIGLRAAGEGLAWPVA